MTAILEVVVERKLYAAVIAMVVGVILVIPAEPLAFFFAISISA